MVDPDNPYGAPFEQGGARPPAADDPVAVAADELRVVRGGASVLTVVAAVAAGLWLLTLVTVLWNTWEMTSDDVTGSFTAGRAPTNRLLQVLAGALGATWGYLLVAVLAYVGSMLLHGQRLRLLVDAAADDD